MRTLPFLLFGLSGTWGAVRGIAHLARINCGSRFIYARSTCNND